jgi:signal transduction histidine kinase
VRGLALVIRRHGLDILVVIAALTAAVEIAVRHDPLREPRTAAWIAAPAVALLVLLLLGRRRFPFGAPAGVWVLGAALSFVDGRLVVFSVAVNAAGLAAAFALGNLRDDRQARLGLAIVVVGAAIISHNDPNRAPADLVFLPAMFAIAWLGGFALRERAGQAESAEQRAALAEREQEALARIAVAEERARIARELHDIVAHAVSVMVLHIGAVRHGLPPERTDDEEALRRVEATGRRALTDMRRLLGAMREDGDGVELGPQPGLARLDGLLAEVRGAGLPVELHIEGEAAPLPRAIDLSAYRIVQEGLTNALKHARAGHADVFVRYGADDVEIEVRDDGDGGGTGGGGGHGLVGVGERVKIYGGDMSAGAANGGGFVLRTRLPIAGYGR